MKHSHPEVKNTNQGLEDKSNKKQDTWGKVKEKKSEPPKHSLKRMLITHSFRRQILCSNIDWKACKESYP